MGESLRLGQWKKIGVMRKDAFFKATVYGVFNLEEKTGKQNWTNPQFLVSCPEYRSSNYAIENSFSVYYVGDGFYELSDEGGIVVDGTVVDVYVVEGDEDDKLVESPNWEKTFEINGDINCKKVMGEMSVGYNESFPLPEDFSANCEHSFFYFFKEFQLLKNTFSYKYINTLDMTNRVARITMETSVANLRRIILTDPYSDFWTDDWIHASVTIEGNSRCWLNETLTDFRVVISEPSNTGYLPTPTTETKYLFQTARHDQFSSNLVLRPEKNRDRIIVDLLRNRDSYKKQPKGTRFLCVLMYNPKKKVAL